MKRLPLVLFTTAVAITNGVLAVLLVWPTIWYGVLAAGGWPSVVTRTKYPLGWALLAILFALLVLLSLSLAIVNFAAAVSVVQGGDRKFLRRAAFFNLVNVPLGIPLFFLLPRAMVREQGNPASPEEPDG